jgi:hypothetical protein
VSFQLKSILIELWIFIIKKSVYNDHKRIGKQKQTEQNMSMPLIWLLVQAGADAAVRSCACDSAPPIKACVCVDVQLRQADPRLN